MVSEGARTPPENALLHVAWAPLPGSQELFLSCPIREVLYEGTRGPGKTEALLMSFAAFVGLGYGSFWRGIIFRQTYKQLADLVVKSQRLFYPIFPGAKFNKSNYSWTWPTGEVLLLRQIRTVDDYWDYHGHEYPFQGWEELTSWKDMACYEMMKSCLRCSKPGVPKIIRGTTNPFGIGHTAVKDYFINPAPRGTVILDDFGNERLAIHGSVYENLYLLQNDPQYVQRLEAIKDPNVRKAWLQGSWDINAGGAVDDLWKEDVHMIHPFELPVGSKLTRSFDWGSARPFSVGWWWMSEGESVRQRDGSNRTFPPGSKVRVGEFYGSNGVPNEGLRWTNARIADTIKEIEVRNNWDVEPGAADAAIYDKSNGWEQSVAEKMAERGVVFFPAPKGPGSRRTRLEMLRGGLEAARERPQEDPGVYAWDTCREYRKQIPALPRDQKDYECVDSGGEDHLYDEVTYELSTCSKMTQAFQLRTH